MRTSLLLLSLLCCTAVCGTAAAFDGLTDDSLSGTRLLSDDEAAEAMVETAALPPQPREALDRAPERRELIPIQDRLRLAEAARPVPRLRAGAER